MTADRRTRAGVAATELALILPLLMLLARACVDYGRVAYLNIALSSAARAGASHAIMTPYDPDSFEPWKLAIQQRARDEMELQTGHDPGMLTTDTTVTVEANGLR